ncbi:Spore germination protein GerKC [Paenibacillus pasadenensis]|uniref:Spore germination protein GerKC n=1 Tax=Paenibacillus pasadenensis TaxID=217090 RepID=A0A2N5NA00_9BACL|nr:Ger(x)C family spore germination protein [Paenibacillus pasadenensis]PLT47162.1 Spore germination protein GerKC [Paenibacillus pasadenensis]
MNRFGLASRLLALLLIAALAAPLSGCWSRNELNGINIVVGMGVDKAKDDGYIVSVQIVNPSQVTTKKTSTSSFSPVVTFRSYGKTLPDALARLTLKAARELYLAHLRILVIGEEIARSGLSKPLDFIARNRELRTDFYLVVAKKASASDILDMYSPIDPIPANSLYTKLDTSDDIWSATGKVTLDRLIRDLATEGKGPALTSIELLGNRHSGEEMKSAQNIEPQTLLRYDGMAAFRGDRMVGWLNENDVRALNLLQNETHHTFLTVECPNEEGLVTLELNQAHARITAHRPDAFEVELRSQQDIADIGCKMDVIDPANQEKLEQLVDAKLVDLLQRSIRKSQKELKVDVFGFGSALHRQHPGLWRRIEDWDSIYDRAKIDIRSKTTIRRIGTTFKSMKDESRP